jgi:hypothetical protein
MKKILIGAVILILISLQANAQRSQEMLYLKNGVKLHGTLLLKSETEYRFETSDKVIWTFSPDEVEKYVPAKVPAPDTTQSLIMRKVILDTLSIDELKLFEDKANGMKNAGRILTLGGISLWTMASMVAGITGNQSPSAYSDDSNRDYYVLSTLKGFGFISALAGAPLWVVGSSRMDKVELLTLDFDELNLYKDKAVMRRNIGIGMTLGGIVLSGAGILIVSYTEGEDESMIAKYSLLAGITSTLFGIPLSVSGFSRKANADLSLQKFNISPDGSMALGLGMTITF